MLSPVISVFNMSLSPTRMCFLPLAMSRCLSSQVTEISAKYLMHKACLLRAFDLKLLKNILKALQKLVSISLQSLKIDLFYQNILPETLKVG